MGLVVTRGRALRMVTLAIVTTFAAASVAGAGTAKPKRIKRDEACTIVTTRQVEKAFGGPVAEGVEQEVVLSCTYLVGTDPLAEPGGSFAAQQLFPSILNTTDSAKAAVEDAHAIAVVTEDDLRDVDDVGRAAYINSTRGEIVVQANKKYAFILIWSPESVVTPSTKAVEKKLIALAKDVVKRAPR